MKDINLIYGKNPVIEAIRAKKALKVFVVNNFNDQKVLSLIKENHLNMVMTLRLFKIVNFLVKMNNMSS